MSVSGAGVSASNESADLAAVMNGGQQFVDRLAQINAAKATLDAAVTSFNLGKSAVAANDEAARTLSEAKNRRDADMAALEKEIADARQAIVAWASQTKMAAQSTLDDATAQLRSANERYAATSAAYDQAQKALADAKAQAALILSNTQSSADATISAANDAAAKTTADASNLMQQAKKSMDEATALKFKYDAALARLQSAITQSS